VSYLLDTNVLSELRRRDPEPKVVRWLGDRPASTLHLSVLTIGELRKGIEGVPDGGVCWRRRDVRCRRSTVFWPRRRWSTG